MNINDFYISMKNIIEQYVSELSYDEIKTIKEKYKNNSNKVEEGTKNSEYKTKM